MNKFEFVKSLILTILVLMSGFFSWSLWTYQSSYETLEQADYFKEVNISHKKELSDIVKPNKLLYHHENLHYGTSSPRELTDLVRYLSSWDYYNIQDMTEEIASSKEFYELVHGPGKIEVNFPTVIPFDHYRRVLNIDDKKLPEIDFDKIVIDIDFNEGLADSSKDGKVYFVNYKSQEVFTASVPIQLILALEENFYNKSFKHARHLQYETGNGFLHVYNAEPILPRNKYLLNLLNVDLFRDALFVNPNVVQKNFLSGEDEYTDTATMMTASYVTRMISYVNPTEETTKVYESSEILEKSIDFVNDHAGWADNYLLVDLLDQKATFRMYLDGYPVFNDRGMSEITQIWGENTIYKYIRPYFTLDILLTSETERITLPSGYEVLEHLENHESFNPELLEQLTPGFQMIKDQEEPRIIVLEPVWYYRYNSAWGKISTEDIGGVEDGLE